MQGPAGFVLGQTGEASVVPLLAGRFGEAALEGLEPAVPFEDKLELREEKVARVAETLQKGPVNREHDALAFAGDDVRAGGKVEQGGQGGGLGVDGAEQRSQPRRVGALEEPVDGGGAGDRWVPEQVAQRLRPARLPGPKEARDPDGARLVRGVDRLLVGIEYLLELVEDVVGRHVLVELVGDHRLVGEVDLDDFFDGAMDVSSEQLGDLHAGTSLGTISAR